MGDYGLFILFNLKCQVLLFFFLSDKREETENGHQLEEMIDAIKRSEECLSICPQNVSVPNCGDLRMVS